MPGSPRNLAGQALIALEVSGVVLRGEFTGCAGETEWCERVLLARIHRLTLGELRREIEPVTAADFMRFLFAWQHIAPGTQLHGRAGVEEMIGQLQGLELPAPAWEQHVLPARIANYDPRALEELCLGGVVSWGRLRPNVKEEDAESSSLPRKRRRRQSRGLAAPISFVLCEDLNLFLGGRVSGAALSASARTVLEYLEK